MPETLSNLHDIVGAGGDLIRWKDCPYCEGRGWFLRNPFATGGFNGAGGLGNMIQCKVCIRAKQHHDLTGEIPPALQKAVAVAKEASGYAPQGEDYAKEIEKLKGEIKRLKKANRDLSEDLEEANSRYSWLLDYELEAESHRKLRLAINTLKDLDPDPHGLHGIPLQQRLDTMLASIETQVEL